MKMTHGKMWWRLLVVFSLAVIACISFYFITQMNSMLESNIMNTTSELATHDLALINNFLERNWNNLNGIQARLDIYDCKTIEAVQERMSMERATGEFHTLYLVAEDGSVYNDRYMKYSKEEMNISNYLEGDQDQIVCSYDWHTTAKETKEMLLHAIRLDDLHVEGVNFTWLVGISPITQIQDRMVIYSFYKDSDSRGYSSVITPSGDYIVNINRTVSINQRSNLYDWLDRGNRESPYTVEVIRESMSRKEQFHFMFTDEDGISEQLFFLPIEGTDWYFLSVVERTVFTDLTKPFVIASISMVIAVILISLMALLMSLRFSKREIKANTEAKVRSEFLSSMSHEIRTPLNGIVGLLHLMQSHLQDGNMEQMTGWLCKANTTTQYLISLLNDILDMSKLQAGKLELVSKPFFLETMLDAIVSMQRGNAQERGVELIVEQNIVAPCITGDETRLKQVLMNIVGNAVKFTQKGGTIRLTAEQKLEDTTHVITTIRCVDTGIGMSPEFLATIWDSFTQENNKVSNGMQGTGLGMPISKGIIEAMEGEISVESELGKGSTFTVTFRSEFADSPAETPRISFDTPEKPQHSMKLLIVEDNALNAEILIEFLQSQGFDTIWAENGKAAVDKFGESEIGEFSAILMDMQMPVMDGCQASQEIRNLNRPDAKSVLIFACTANSFQEDKERALKSGMSDFLTKPINFSELMEKLAGSQ